MTAQAQYPGSRLLEVPSHWAGRWGSAPREPEDSGGLGRPEAGRKDMEEENGQKDLEEERYGFDFL